MNGKEEKFGRMAQEEIALRWVRGEVFYVFTVKVFTIARQTIARPLHDRPLHDSSLKPHNNDNSLE
jgi:hypothetical protein